MLIVDRRLMLLCLGLGAGLGLMLVANPSPAAEPSLLAQRLQAVAQSYARSRPVHWRGTRGSRRRDAARSRLRPGQPGMATGQRARRPVPAGFGEQAVHGGCRAASGGPGPSRPGRPLAPPPARHAFGLAQHHRAAADGPHLGHPQSHRRRRLRTHQAPAHEPARDRRDVSGSAVGLRARQRHALQQFGLHPAGSADCRL